MSRLATQTLARENVMPSAGYSRHEPVSARIVEHRRLTHPDSDKAVYHIEFDPGAAGLEYQAGDTVGIWFRNCPHRVEEVLALTGLDANDAVVVADEIISLGNALQRRFELTSLHVGFIKRFAGICRAESLKGLLDSNEAMREFLNERHVTDVLREHPLKLTAEELVSCLRPLTPRSYSIASSPGNAPGRVAITVNHVQYEAFGLPHTGACSSFLAGLVAGSDGVELFIESKPAFRLPLETDRALIMIGPGTGIAPFRAFLQDCESNRPLAATWLFTGNPRQRFDYLYQGELEHWLESGVLDRLDLAFSRDQADKYYVQHAMRENSAELFSWLEAGASVYVCGDARRMAGDVQNTLLEVIAEEGGMDAAQARQYLVAMSRAKRYQRDVY